MFKVVLTEYGFCITDTNIGPIYQPDKTDGHLHGTNTSTKMLDITLAYNISDWTAGYCGEIGGFTAYFSPPGERSELRDIKTKVMLRRVEKKDSHQIFAVTTFLKNLM